MALLTTKESFSRQTNQQRDLSPLRRVRQYRSLDEFPTKASDWRAWKLVDRYRERDPEEVKAHEYALKRGMNRRFLITGTTGGGKSRLFYQMFDQIRDRGDKAIIVDHGGENIMRYFRPGDVILNPFDARFPG